VPTAVAHCAYSLCSAVYAVSIVSCGDQLARTPADAPPEQEGDDDAVSIASSAGAEAAVSQEQLVRDRHAAGLALAAALRLWRQQGRVRSLRQQTPF
jgi:hypothetical protein